MLVMYGCEALPTISVHLAEESSRANSYKVRSI